MGLPSLATIVPGRFFFSESLVGVCPPVHKILFCFNKKNKIRVFLCPKQKANNFKNLLCVKMREAVRAREAVREATMKHQN